MKKTGTFLTVAAGLIVIIVIISLIGRQGRSTLGPAETEGMAQGTVFLDRNANGLRDRGEPGLAGVGVSDQRTVTITDRQGRWALPAHDEAFYFVIKPRGYMTAPDEKNLPQFYYLHKQTEELDLYGPTLPRTGPLPASIDFPLTRHDEPERFTAVIMGDPQPRDITEVNYLAHDIIEELVGTEALFAMTLGDLTFDDLALYPALNAAFRNIGVPVYHVLGNHDANYDGRDPYEHYETWRTQYGPCYYSFDYGPVHFVILADVLYPESGNRYITGLGEQQLDWLESDLAHVPSDRLIVLSMHIPLTSAERTPDFGRLYELLQDRPHTLSISAHSHVLAHGFLTAEHGWLGAEPHHHINAGATCGRWWSGNEDETGIPHTSSSDGTPNGYFIVTFDGHSYSTRYKAARRPADYQMQIEIPDEVSHSQLADTPVFVNVFNGSSRSTVEMSVDEDGEWIALEHAPQVDPLYNRIAREQSEQRGSRCEHMWEGRLPAGLEPGGHLIRVRTTDMHGQVFTGSRILRVVEDGASQRRP